MDRTLQLIITANTAEAVGAMEGLRGETVLTGETAMAAAPEVATVGEAAAVSSGGFLALGGSMLAALPELAAILGLYEGGKALIKEFTTDVSTHQNVESSLNATLSARGSSFGLSIDQANQMAEATQKNTTATKDQNLSTLNTLLGFNTLTKDQMPSLIGLTNDLAAKLAHGAAPSMDQTNQAAKLLGKAMEDPATGATALARAGVKLSAQQIAGIKDTEKHSGVLAAQGVLHKDLSGIVAGQASAAQDTLSGKVKSVKNAFEEMAGKVSDTAIKVMPAIGDAMNKGADIAGKMLGPAFADVGKAVEDLTKMYDKHKKGIDQIIGVLIKVGEALLWLTIEAFAQAIKDVARLIEAFSKIIDISSAIIKAFAGAGRWLWQAGKDIIQGLIDGVNGMIGAVGKAVGGVANTAVNSVKNLLGIHSPSTVFAEIGQNMGQGMIEGITGMHGAVQQATGGLVGVPSGGSAAGGVSAGGGVVVNVHVDNLVGVGGVQQLSNLIYQTLQQEARANGFGTALPAIGILPV